MSYATVSQVRTISGLTTSQMGDADLQSVINLADSIIDNEPSVTLTSDLKTLASAYLSSAMALERVAANISSSGSGVVYSLGSLRVDKKSAMQFNLSMANNFRNVYRQLINFGIDGTGVKRIS